MNGVIDLLNEIVENRDFEPTEKVMVLLHTLDDVDVVGAGRPSSGAQLHAERKIENPVKAARMRKHSTELHSERTRR